MICRRFCAYSSSVTAPALRRLSSSCSRSPTDRDGGGFWWTTLADPQGNEFCVADANAH